MPPLELATSITATEDDRLAQAEALVRSYCHWHIAPVRTDTLTLLRSLDRTIPLPTLHLTNVESITVNDVVQDPSGYKWTTSGVVSRFAWPHLCRDESYLWQDVNHWQGPTVTISFTHGYETPPAEVTAIVQAVARRAASNPDSLVRDQAGPFHSMYSMSSQNQAAPLALLAEERRTLEAYRIPPRA